MAMMLKLLGHDVATGHDGQEAVDLAKTFQSHVAFLDIGIPNVNGNEAACLLITPEEIANEKQDSESR